MWRNLTKRVSIGLAATWAALGPSCADAQISLSVPGLLRRGVGLSAGQATPPAAMVTFNAMPAPGAVAGANGAVPDPAQETRLERIRQLQFDRRPSAILKAWYEPSETAPVEDKPAAAPAAAAPSPTDTAAPTDEAARLAAEQQQKAAQLAQEQATALAKLEADLKTFQRDVTQGHWEDVKQFISSLAAAEARELYNRLLESLRTGPVPEGINPQLMQKMILDGMSPIAIQQMLAAGGQGPGAQFIERNVFGMGDVVGLIKAAPTELNEEDFARLGTIVRLATAGGHDLGELLAKVSASSAEPMLASLLNARQTALLLFAAGEELRAGDYLPTLDVARDASDAEGLNLLARHHLARHHVKENSAQLELAWEATQAVLAIELPAAPVKELPAGEPPAAAAPEAEPQATETPATETPAVEGTTAQLPGAPAPPTPTPAELAAKRRAQLKQSHDEALQRAVELAPRVRDALGQRWLDESFGTDPTRGRAILGTIGALTSTNLSTRPGDAAFRLRSLELQQTAVAALLRAVPENDAAWRDVLTLLAQSWLQEARASYQLDQGSHRGRGWQRDRYGNYFFNDPNNQQPMFQMSGQEVQPIEIGELLEVRPSDDWQARVRSEIMPGFQQMLAQLYLKVEEEANAFPYIERLAATHPREAQTLAATFVGVWTSNHDPNSNQGRDPFMYYWGYEQRADRIPLTRSKQERNLRELADWLRKLRALPIEPLEETLLTRAFTTAHSKAEVYRLEAIEEVFGSIDQLPPRALAELVQQMRGNLATVWQLPDVQKQNSTNRKQRDIQLEVVRGYELARATLGRALEKHPDHWALILADAAVQHDENDYRNELEKNAEFAPRRLAALARFRQAAELYALAVPALPEAQQSTQVYEQWFYASLGAVDLGRVLAKHVAETHQPPAIREALAALSGDRAEFHRAQFANNLFTRVSTAKPELKYRYLKSGFEIVGDHKMAREARKLLDYYADLVTEIKLQVQVDGPDVVGHQQPFGVFVNLVHTKEIERESGGFARYLQNQNNNQYYFYNFGRPTENYRDKFQDTVNQALGEQFEVLSVTFQDPQVTSKALPEYGWRVTPYAYLLLRARGAEVDKLAPLRLDLDFLDTSGYAVLPIESPAVPIDAQPEQAPARPAELLALTQTLDERQAGDGILKLEIRATALGLIPELSELVEAKPPGFDVSATDDGGVSIKEFSKDSDQTRIVSERLWTITYRASAADARARPTSFEFASALVPVKEVIFQRYEDADLVPVAHRIALEQRYGRTQRRWGRWAALATGTAAMAVCGVLLWRRRQRRPLAPAAELPDPLTPFTVLGFLRNLEARVGLSADRQTELRSCIDELESHYFRLPGTHPHDVHPAGATAPDLETIARAWLPHSERATNGRRAHAADSAVSAAV